ncbi:hypothetical protein Rhal01_01028 [Rubritalea halochordaticola]|uniref:Nickel/cobalt efflux system n=1 Tax=Rubritalea halochordaticola TaxID=714537 RepID=A0ABP9UWM3_9BACT
MKCYNWRLSLFFILSGLVLPLTYCQAEVRDIGWKELLPSNQVEFDDPFAKLNESQLWDLGLIARYRMLRERDTSGLIAARTQEEKKLIAELEAQGIDVDWILSQRERVARERKKRAERADANIDGTKIRIPGYALPLQVQGGRIVEFLLVPWIGACVHSPPPPPNQMIHVTVPEGMPDLGLFTPVWVEGIIKLQPKQYQLFLVDGSSVVNVAYLMKPVTVSEYSSKDSDILAQIEAPASSPDHGWFQNLQAKVSLLFTKTMTTIRDRESSGPLWWGVFISFVYGLVHTLGPGHGKAVVISYFVGEGGSFSRGLLMGTKIAIFHVLSAIILVWVTDFTVRRTTGQAPSDYQTVKLVSYAMIAVIGGWMLWKALRVARHSHEAHDHNDGCCACVATPKEHWSLNGWLALAVGGVPCTGALLVLLFGMANDLLGPAVLLVLAISAGMAVAMSGIGVLALWGRRIVGRRASSEHHKRESFENRIRVVGALAVLLIGLCLFAITLGSRVELPLHVSETATENMKE